MTNISEEKAIYLLEKSIAEIDKVINTDTYTYVEDSVKAKISILDSNIRYIDHSKNMFSHYDIDYSEAETAKANALNYINYLND